MPKRYETDQHSDRYRSHWRSGQCGCYAYEGYGNLFKTTDVGSFLTEYTCSVLDLVGNINYNGSKQVNCAYNKTSNLVEDDQLDRRDHL